MSETSPSVFPSPQVKPLPLIKVGLLVAALVLAALGGEVMRPNIRLSDLKPKIVLDKQIPESFGNWRLDTSIRPVVPDPNLQAMLDSLYSQTLARTYVDRTGQRVMLSIAYGSDQSSEATAVHRPEFCYSSQGFRVQVVRKEYVDISGTKVPVARLQAQLGQRQEPITYWVTLDEEATLPGLGRKLKQIRYGLKGQIPDGMLVRVSSISASTAESFALQQQFLEQLFSALPADVRARYFGSGAV